MENAETWILALGFSGQALFGSRFLVQWIASERQGKSVIPLAFWYLSLGGAAILFSYALIRRDPVFMLGQATGSIVYLRNLALIRKENRPGA
jgi:lipid-A-disaccharide synthase-like uncharacterized protein